MDGRFYTVPPRMTPRRVMPLFSRRSWVRMHIGLYFRAEPPKREREPCEKM